MGIHCALRSRAAPLGSRYLSRHPHRSPLVQLRLRTRHRLGFYARKVDISALGPVVPTGFTATDNLLESERRETFNLLHLRRTRHTYFLSVPHPFARYISKHSILRLRLYRRDERSTAPMGPADAEMNGHRFWTVNPWIPPN